jgi:UDP-N-acetylmuramoyl-tripeptide--D-alanyl-D-alanine ligase
MKTISLRDLVVATGGTALSTQATSFHGVGTDTRADLTGRIFVALKGEQFDAHQFLPAAVASGAAALLVHEEPPADIKNKITVVLVKDTLAALQRLANFERRKSKAVVVGITGSNGKTTSKEFTAALVGTKRKVHYSKGSFNNHWGVPLTLLAEPEGTEVSIVEMGMNHAGELTELCRIAEPDIVVCSTVGAAHIEFFGTLEKIAEAKEEIYKASPASAIRIFNLDNPYTKKMHEHSLQTQKSKRVITFSSQETGADVRLKIDELSMSSLKISGTIGGGSGGGGESSGEKAQAQVAVFGAQNLTNLMVAASVGLAVGLSPKEIWAALPACKTNWGRNQLVHTRKGAEILFDGYNANPDSMRALLENVALIQNRGKKIGVFGQMLELGAQSSQLHQTLGEKAGGAGFDMIWFYGPDAESFMRGIQNAGFKKSIMISKSYEEALASKIASVLDKDDVALVKGSRGMKLERFVMACDPLDFSLNKN